jgi:hypothetical protein
MSTVFPTLGWLITKAKALRYESQAAVLLQESMEVVYNVFLQDWSGVYGTFGDGVYHPAREATVDPSVQKWTLAEGEKTGVETRFTRKIELVSVCRNSADGSQSGCGPGAGTDLNSRKVRSEIAWVEGGVTRTLKAELLLVRLEN